MAYNRFYDDQTEVATVGKVLIANGIHVVTRIFEVNSRAEPFRIDVRQHNDYNGYEGWTRKGFRMTASTTGDLMTILSAALVRASDANKGRDWR